MGIQLLSSDLLAGIFEIVSHGQLAGHSLQSHEPDALLPLREVCRAFRDAVDVTIQGFACCAKPNEALSLGRRRAEELMPDVLHCLRHVLPRWPRLTEVKLEYTLGPRLLRRALEALAEGCPRIQVLHLAITAGGGGSLSDLSDCLGVLASMPSLQDVRLEHFDKYVTPNWPDAWPEIPSLRKLKLLDFGSVGMGPLPMLEELDLENIVDDVIVGVADLRHLHLSSRLVRLKISWLSIREVEGRVHLPSLENLEELRLLAVEGLTRPLRVSTQFPKLRTLEMQSVRLEGPLFLTACPSLTHLSLVNMSTGAPLELPGSLRKVSLREVEGLAHVPSSESLEELVLEGLFGPGGVRVGMHFPKLTTLRLNSVEVEGPLSLMSCRSLTHLSLAHVSGSAAPLGLEQLESLRTLHLWFLEIQELPMFDNFSHLEKLHISFWFHLETLPALASCTRLKSLKLHSLKQMAGVPEFSRMPTLERVEIGECPRMQLHGGLSRATGLKRLRLADFDDQTPLPPLTALVGLQQLRISDCKHLQELPALGALGELRTLGIACLNGVKCLPALSLLTALTDLEVTDCTVLLSLPLGSLQCLNKLSLRGLAVADLPDMSRCTSLRTIDITLLPNLQSVGPFMNSGALESLTLHSCKRLESMRLGPLQSLHSLTILDCPIQILYLEGLESLKRLKLNGLKLLTLRELSTFPCLEELSICRVPNLRFMRSLGGPGMLQSLELGECEGLQQVDIGLLPRLMHLNVFKCPTLAFIRGSFPLLTDVRCGRPHLASSSGTVQLELLGEDLELWETTEM